MVFTRRALIQKIGLLSAGLWMGNRSLVQRYQSVLAQTTARKLALLVGVNQYPRMGSISPLKGSVTDVELQHELLTHRFGFSRRDILTLVDQEATRSNIEAAFTTHLIDQARPGDIVVFHFSGYGCLVQTNAPPEKGGQRYGDQQALVPYDAGLLDGGLEELPLFNGIYEDTLFLLLRSLSTDQVTTLLDCGFLPSATLRCKSLRERALLPWDGTPLLEAELVLQDRLLAQTQLTRDQVQVQRQSGQLPGLVLAAATAKQSAALEQDYPEFSAGLFSSGLTQQLWANTPAPNLTIQFGQLSSQLSRQIGPGLQVTAQGQKGLGMLPWSTQFADIPALGVVNLVDRRGKTVKLWLGGLPTALLEQYQVQSCFRTEATPATWVQMKSRQGWTAIAQHLSGPLLQAGLLLQEAIRVLPRRISLRLALDSNLSRIEQVDAMSVVSTQRSRLRLVRSEQPADYIFTKLPVSTATDPQLPNPSPLTLSLNTLSTASYGLAYLGGGVVPNTVGDRGEVVKRALERLQSTLEILLAIKLLELSLNHSATALRVSATLEQLEETSQPLIRVQSAGVILPQPPDKPLELEVPKADKTSKVLSLPNGTAIQYRISNWDTVPIYVLVVGFNGGTSAFASYALDGSPTTERKPTLKPIVIQPSSSVILPIATQAWKASSLAGLNQTFVLCTRVPLAHTLIAQSNSMKSMLPSLTSGFTPLLKPLAIAQAIFADLHQASFPTTSALGITNKNLWALDITEWATLQFVYTTL